MNYYREVENLIKRGEKRAKYGDGLIKEWGEKLSLKYSKGYNARKNAKIIYDIYVTTYLLV